MCETDLREVKDSLEPRFLMRIVINDKDICISYAPYFLSIFQGAATSPWRNPRKPNLLSAMIVDSDVLEWVEAMVFSV